VRRKGPVDHVPGSPAVEMLAVTVHYQRTVALDRVTMHLPSGGHIAVLGPNGAGKSTLLKVVAGVVSPTSGEVRVHGRGPQRHTCIAYLPQRSAVDWSFPITVREVVAMGRMGGLPPWRRASAHDRARVEESLAQVGLSELANRHIGELSGGQEQRMFLARALAQRAQLFLMDEPLAGLDVGTQRELLRLVRELPHATVIVAMHELGMAQESFPQVMLLNTGIVAAGPPESVFIPEYLAQAYGRTLQFVRSAEGTLAVSDSCRPPEDADR